MPAPGTSLLDANVWLALAVGDHFHHAAAKEWFDNQSESSCAFCRVTQMAFLRHLTNSRIIGQTNVRSQAAAWLDYEALSNDPRIVYLEEPTGAGAQFKQRTQSPHPSHAGWTDAYLAAFAKTLGLGIVTFDADFSNMPDLKVTTLGVVEN